MRIGHGFDVHPFQEGRDLILGGVHFEGETGLAGHSDGDTLTHAIVDALLGAAALGDIGMHYPSDRQELRGADSIEMLRQVCKLVMASGYEVVNLDTTIIAEKPRVGPYVAEMRRRLALALGIDVGRVSIKATTTDRIGSIGRAEGIAAEALVLIDEV